MIGLVLLSLAAGALTGIGGLTQYAFIGMIIPVAIFLAVFGGQWRAACCVAALLAFVAVLTPWLARNYAVSGTPLGTAGYAMLESHLAGKFRCWNASLQPDIPQYNFRMYFWKIGGNLVSVLQE